ILQKGVDCTTSSVSGPIRGCSAARTSLGLPHESRQHHVSARRLPGIPVVNDVLRRRAIALARSEQEAEYGIVGLGRHEGMSERIGPAVAAIALLVVRNAAGLEKVEQGEVDEDEAARAEAEIDDQAREGAVTHIDRAPLEIVDM